MAPTMTFHTITTVTGYCSIPTSCTNGTVHMQITSASPYHLKDLICASTHNKKVPGMQYQYQVNPRERI
ncbi:unnamed protein product [Allacma fusca]|uniref:Uncharacterized protein n=1 Tax=Allacma fusca TaxID=39272 RepID=A0A8J2K117_9HEXA|nr:unnamed protein product [Allacma fusca]